MNTNEVMQIALLAGEILLKSGAEVFRVEDTIIRISRNYGVNCECFAMPTGIFISSNGSGKEFVSYVKRIKERAMDLHRIELINSFSRNIEKEKLSFDEAMEALKKIENAPYFKFPLRLFSAAMTAAVYTILFKGNMWDSLAAFLITMVIYSFNEMMGKIGSFQFLQLLVAGGFAGFASIIAARTFPILSIDKIIIGAIMILVPGMAITNGIKDALYGDIVSSLSRLGEAIFVVVAVGIGVAISLLLGTRWV